MLAELMARLQSSQVTCEEITQSCLNCIREQNPRLNAFIEVFEESALAEARASDLRRKNGQVLSALDGIPIAVKDNICIKGRTCAAGSKMLANFVSPYDATAIARVKAAGLPILGRLNMDEFGMGSSTETSFYGATRNPLDESRVPGGSSGGAAAAVASGMTPLALGSDTGGSIRQPAALCGVTGVKPAYGSISRYGLIAFASSLDQIGVIANSARDATYLLEVLCGQDARDLTTAPDLFTPEECSLPNARFVLPEECLTDGLHPDIRKHILNMADRLGAERVSIPLLPHALDAYYVISSAEASSNLARYDGLRYGYHADTIQQTRQEGFGLEVKRRILLGTYALSSGYQQQYYLKAQAVREKLTAQLNDLLTRYDAIIMPVTPQPAWKLGEKTDPMSVYLGDVFTVPANLAGLPAAATRGLGLMTGKNHLGKLLSLCSQIEEVFP